MAKQSFFFDPVEIGVKNKADISDEPSMFSGCDVCPMQTKCLRPKMEPYGKNNLRIAIVGEAPGEEEDKLGRPFVGRAGQVLRQAFQ